jgi:chromosome segregation ATPase
MISITHACSACGFQWKSGENGAHDCSKNLRVQREDLQRDFLDLRNRAELAEKSALDLKAIADHMQRQRAETEAAHGRIYDEKNKEIAELQSRMTRYERLLEDAEGNAETLRKAYDEAKNRADSTTHGKDIADLQKQNGQLYKDLNDKHESWRNTQVRLEKAIKERDEYAKVAADLQKALRNQCAELMRERDAYKAENEGRAGATDTEAQLDSLERDNDRLRAVLDGIKSSIDGIQTLVTLSE